MGFYGNITNTSRTQFQFDKIYPNRVEMERAKLTDSIYLGRHVLIEYDSNYHRDSYLRVWFDEANIAYTSDKYESDTSLKNSDAEENPIVVVYGENEDKFYAWQKPEEYDSKEDGAKIAQYDEIVGSNDLLYTINYAIDLNAYKVARGYDSTVWQKVYSEGFERYVMIAELNTVVPTFDISADAPTMSPITPHFDTRSTDVYYKLHWQAPWGFRLAAADKNTTNNKSDLITSWERESYNPNTGVTTKEYYFSDEKQWRALKDGELIPQLNAAIYFNQAGFDEYNPSYIDGIGSNENQIKVTASGKSGQEYNKHDGSIDVEQKIDTQEMIINLPGVGNMMSKAWDIIHGPNRDDARTDENGSLQGRLDSFKDMAADEIPVKRGEDGTIIGATINGGKTSSTDLTGKNDDAWIETMVNGDIETITIKHTFNEVDNTNTESNKNTDGGNGVNIGIGDTLKLYTPIVDAAGHVVGKNTETVTLPYGFKTIKTNGRSAEVSENATGTPAAADIVADNTQDELTINSGNKWIRIDTDANNDSLTIRHDVHATTSDENTTNWTQSEVNTTIPVVTYEYDEAGHYTKHHTENYQLPFGYGKIKGDNGSTAATATYDEVTFTSDEWLTATITKDTVTYSHDYPKKINDTTSESNVNDNGDTIVLETLERDDKGHVIKVNQNTVTLPFGYKTFVGDSGTTSANNTQDSMSITGDNWVQTTVSDDKIAFAHIGPVSGTATEVSAETPAFGATFSIDDHYFDDKGHKFTSKSHTVKIPSPSLANGTGNVVTGLSLVSATGALTETKANLGEIKLGTYDGGDNSDNLTADITLQQALSRLQNKITNEAANRQTAIEALDVTDTAVEGQYVSAVNEVDGKIQVSRANLPVYATIEQGTKADSALQFNTPFTYNDTTKTIEELLKMVIDLQAKVVALEAKVNENHPIENTETTE